MLRAGLRAALRAEGKTTGDEVMVWFNWTMNSVQNILPATEAV